MAYRSRCNEASDHKTKTQKPTSCESCSTPVPWRSVRP